MTSIREMIRRRFSPAQALPAGIYQYQAPPEDPRNYRLHLRLEPDGSGILIINAHTILHLNQTAAEYAYHLLQQTPEEQVAVEVASRYHVSRAQAGLDFQDLVKRIDSLVTTTDLDPVTFLDFDRLQPYSVELSAPYRLDCALTYRLSPSEDPEAAPQQRVTRELNTQEWKTILDKAWQVGIPHVTFTGGEPTLRDDLPDLIAHTESLGQVAGLLTDGKRLADAGFFHTLLQTGLDHLLIILDAEDEDLWALLPGILKEDIFTAVHLSITDLNAAKVPGYLKRLAGMGVNAISLSASGPELNKELQAARHLVASLDVPLIWDLPVPYSTMHPVALELENNEKQEGAGRAWLYIEPDGDVLPAQGKNQVLGNILKDPWDSIWQNPKRLSVG